jgi:hypothetical protein
MLGACHANWRGTGCFGTIHASGAGFPRRPLAQKGYKVFKVLLALDYHPGNPIKK